MGLRTGGILALALGLAMAAPATAGEIWERPWVEASSPNFTVLSAVSEEQTRNLVKELEDFRQVVRIFTNAAVMAPRVPTVLFVFPGKFPDVGLDGLIAGFFSPGMRGNVAVVSATDRSFTTVTIQHEYTHFVMRNQSALAYPHWYEEGFAELLSTVDLREGRFDLGNANAGRMMDLGDSGWIPYERVVDDEQFRSLKGNDKLLFYAQSWALVHYLTWGKPGFDFPARMADYLNDVEDGQAPVPAFEAAFGEKTGELRAVIQRYLRRAKYGKGALRQPFPVAQVAVRKLRADEVAAALGNLCIVTSHVDKAARYTDAALGLNPRNARALVDKADLLKVARAFDQAEPMYRQAIALEPGNDRHHLDFGEYWMDRGRAAADAAARADFVRQARIEYAEANKINDRNPETLAMYSLAVLASGQGPAKALDAAEFANELLPSSPQIKMILAQVYMALGRRTDARPLLLTVRAWESEGGSNLAEALLKELDAADAAAAAPSSAPKAAPGPPRSSLPVPSR